MTRSTTTSSAVPCLCNVLRQASRSVSRIYDDALRPSGLRATQFALLSFLSRSGAVPQRELAARTALEETTVTRNLRPLAQRGWINIAPGKDLREKLVSITPAGSEILNAARPAWAQVQEQMRRLVSGEDWQSLVTTLGEITQATAKAAD